MKLKDRKLGCRRVVLVHHSCSVCYKVSLHRWAGGECLKKRKYFKEQVRLFSRNEFITESYASEG